MHFLQERQESHVQKVGDDLRNHLILKSFERNRTAVTKAPKVCSLDYLQQRHLKVEIVTQLYVQNRHYGHSNNILFHFFPIYLFRSYHEKISSETKQRTGVDESETQTKMIHDLTDGFIFNFLEMWSTAN